MDIAAVKYPEEIMPVLENQLYDSNPDIVAEGALHLAGFKSSAVRSVPRLRELSMDANNSVRMAAVYALKAIEPAGMLGSLDDRAIAFKYPLLSVKQSNDTTGVPTASPETADIRYAFSSLPVMQALDLYEDLVGKKVAIPAPGFLTAKISVNTPVPMTKSEAVELFEKLFREQASFEICHGTDGSLSIKPMNLNGQGTADSPTGQRKKTAVHE